MAAAATTTMTTTKTTEEPVQMAEILVARLNADTGMTELWPRLAAPPLAGVDSGTKRGAEPEIEKKSDEGKEYSFTISGISGSDGDTDETTWSLDQLSLEETKPQGDWVIHTTPPRPLPLALLSDPDVVLSETLETATSAQLFHLLSLRVPAPPASAAIDVPHVVISSVDMEKRIYAEVCVGIARPKGMLHSPDYSLYLVTDEHRVNYRVLSDQEQTRYFALLRQQEQLNPRQRGTGAVPLETPLRVEAPETGSLGGVSTIITESKAKMDLG